MSFWLKGLNTDGGFLEKAAVEFSPGLNCIIGARGTCKSTLVESLRFALDVDAERVGAMVSATLGDGTVTVRLEGEVPYTVERAVGEEPRVYQDGVKDVAARALLSSVEIYSQGDLQKIAEQPLRRLALIDARHRAEIDRLKSEQMEAAERLARVGAKIRETRGQIEATGSAEAELAELQAQLEASRAERPALPKALATERDGHEARQRALDQAKKLVEQERRLFELCQQLAPLAGEFRALAGTFGELKGKPAGQVAKAASGMAERVEQFAALISEPLVAQAVAKAEEDFESRSEAYYTLRRSEEDLNSSLRKEDLLTKQIQGLQQRVQARTELQAQLDGWLEERTRLRSTVARSADRLYELRVAEVDAINRAHSKVVVLRLLQGRESAEQEKRLLALLKGSRMKKQEELVRDLASLGAAELIDLVEAGDGKKLSETIQRDATSASKLIGHLADQDDLYELESSLVEDRLEITMFVDDVEKPIEHLSKGQMATALLPLILRQAEQPLIFDQPEDDLDNRFVFETLVETVTRLKAERQLLFVTHNANIPVLGEAEQVIVMSMETPERAAAPVCGSVDEVKQEILRLLEGGAEAFTMRRKKYSPLVK